MTDQQTGWPPTKPLKGTWNDNYGRYPQAEPPTWKPPAPPKKHPFWKAFGVTVGIVVALLVVGAISNAVERNSSTDNSSYNGPTEHAVEQKVLSDLHKTTGDGFDVPNAAQVVCNMPSQWKPGKVGTCYIYAGSGEGLGTATITVQPSTGNDWRWNDHWQPSP